MAISGGVAAETTAAPSASASATDNRLHGNLHVWDIILMVVATSAPLTVIVGVYPIGFSIGNGAGYPSAYLGLGILLLIFAVGFTTMTRHVPNPGAFFTYIANGLGRPLGLAGAYVALLCYLCIELAVLAYFGYDASVTIAQATGVHIHWLVFTAGEWIIIAYLGYRNIGLSAKVLGVLLTVEILISLVLSFAIVFQGGASGLDGSSFSLHEILAGAPALGLMFAGASFIGFESTAIYRDEARDPARTIPRATYGAVIILGVFYTFTAWAFVMAWGPSNVVHAASTDPEFLFTTAKNYAGGIGLAFTQVFVITSIFAVTLAFHNIVARYLHALGSVRALPKYLGKAGTQKSPAAASLTTSAITFILVVLTLIFGVAPVTTFAWFAGLGTLAYLIVLAACSAAVFVYFLRKTAERREESFWKVLVCPIIATLGLAFADYITIINFPLLVGDVDSKGNPVFGGLSAALLILFAACIVIGIVQAYVMRATNRKAYKAITEAGREL